MSKTTADIDLPEEYWKDLRIIGVSRDGENSKVLLVSFTRQPSDKELREFHQRLSSHAYEGHTRERLQAIIDWADLALDNPKAFDSHGTKLLTGPAFDAARATLDGEKP